MKIISMLFLFLPVSLFASWQDSGRPWAPGHQEDYLEIYYDEAYDFIKSSLLSKEILIFNNKKLEGNPEYIIKNDGIIINGNLKKLSYIFKNKDNKNETEIYSLRDFIKFDNGEAYLAYRENEVDIYKTLHNGKDYFFKLDNSFFSSRPYGQYYRWRIYTNETGAREVIRNYFLKDAEFKTFWDNLKNCVEKKDGDCFNANFDKGDDKELYKRLLENITMISDKDICDVYNNANAYKVKAKSLIKKYAEFPWNDFEKILNLADDKSISYKVQKSGKDNISQVSVEILRDKNGPCGNALPFKLKFIKDESKLKKHWFFKDIELYDVNRGDGAE